MPSDGDTRLLEHALDGDVDRDWKKLDRKAILKMKFKTRPMKIQEIHADMLQTFKDNFSDAEKKEEKDASTSKTLMEQKNSQLSAAQDALIGGDAEGGARASSIEESYPVMITEWKERMRLRSEEISSIEKAIKILTSDEARDTISASFEFHGNLLKATAEAHHKAIGSTDPKGVTFAADAVYEA